MDADGKEGASGYIAQNGQIMSLACSGTQVRPTGQGTVFPPTPANHSPTGFSISMEVEKQGKLQLEVQHTKVLSAVDPTGMRWIGSVKGGFAGKQQYSGSALYEQFVFS